MASERLESVEIFSFDANSLMDNGIYGIILNFRSGLSLTIRKSGYCKIITEESRRDFPFSGESHSVKLILRNETTHDVVSSEITFNLNEESSEYWLICSEGKIGLAAEDDILSITCFTFPQECIGSVHDVIK